MEPNHLRRRIIGTCTDGFYCKSGLLLQIEFLASFRGSVCGPVSAVRGLLCYSPGSEIWYYCKCSMYSVIDHKGFCCVGAFFLLPPPSPLVLKDPSEFCTTLKITLCAGKCISGDFV